jgi:hypothetical protein
MAAKKPELTLIKGKGLTPEALAMLYERLTGRKPTAEELESARQKLAKESADRDRSLRTGHRP